MRIYDISWPLSSVATAYKDKKTISFTALKSFEKDHARETLITLNAHSGTHIDAPSHFEKEGKTIDMLDLGQVIGPCKVLDLQQVAEKIMPEDLAVHDIQAGDIILCKTANSARLATDSFDPQFVYLSSAAAEYVATKRIKAIGIDYLGIERNQPAHETHHIFFANYITIIEGLRLQQVPPGNYFLCCLPLYVQGLEAAPARAILFDCEAVGLPEQQEVREAR